MPGEARTVDALEEEKVTELRAAQNKAEGLFHEVDARGLRRDRKTWTLSAPGHSLSLPDKPRHNFRQLTDEM